MHGTAAMKTAPVIRNGVDVTALNDSVAAIKADPALAKFQFRAANAWQGGARNRSAIKGFSAGGQEDGTRKAPFVLHADEPEVLLGEDSAPNPTEFVLHALASCLTTTTACHAAARGIDIEAIDSTLEGDLDLRGFLGLAQDVRKGFSAVRVRLRVKTKAPRAVVAELASFSPVFDIVSKSLPVELAIETY